MTQNEEGSRMTYISSNYVYTLFVCASAVISSECDNTKNTNSQEIVP